MKSLVATNADTESCYEKSKLLITQPTNYAGFNI